MKPAFWVTPSGATQVTGRLQLRLRPSAVRWTAGALLGEGLWFGEGVTIGVGVELAWWDGVGVTDAAGFALLEHATSIRMPTRATAFIC
jgi:hypothetical protein